MKQFDLEQDIMACWNIVEDLKLLNEFSCESREFNRDKVSNICLGLEELYDLKFQKLFRTFEGFLKEYYELKKA
jgi:hypothetical protein